MSSCVKPTSEVVEVSVEGLASDSPGPSGPTGDPLGAGGGSGPSGGSGGPNWSDEFKKRRHAFENAVENEDGAMFEFADQAASTRK
jgi:hypothetical protein